MDIVAVAVAVFLATCIACANCRDDEHDKRKNRD